MDQPLISRRSSKKKSSSTELSVSNSESKNESSSDNSLESEEERRKRKNKEQVQILKNEYQKNSNWTRAYMKELGQRVGLKPSQVYKWNWD